MAEPAIAFDSLNQRAIEIGKALLARIHEHKASVTTFNKWAQELVSWCLSNPDIKARILRFVDVLPSLETD